MDQFCQKCVRSVLYIQANGSRTFPYFISIPSITDGEENVIFTAEKWTKSNPVYIEFTSNKAQHQLDYEKTYNWANAQVENHTTAMPETTPNSETSGSTVPLTTAFSTTEISSTSSSACNQLSVSLIMVFFLLICKSI